MLILIDSTKIGIQPGHVKRCRYGLRYSFLVLYPKSGLTSERLSSTFEISGKESCYTACIFCQLRCRLTALAALLAYVKQPSCGYLTKSPTVIVATADHVQRLIQSDVSVSFHRLICSSRHSRILGCRHRRQYDVQGL